MMKKSWLILGVVLLASILVAGCGNAAQPQPAMAVATAASDNASDYLALLDSAQEAFSNGNFDEASNFAQQAAALSPDKPSAWKLLDEIAVARAGDKYLNELPPSRYRIDPLHFLANRVNGTTYFIIDVREPEEFAAGHIDGAVNIPLHELLDNPARLPESKTMPILLYCHTQKRATHALVVLRELGYTNVYNLEGGWAAYKDWIDNNPMPTPGPTATPTEEPPSC